LCGRAWGAAARAVEQLDLSPAALVLADRRPRAPGWRPGCGAVAGDRAGPDPAGRALVGTAAAAPREPAGAHPRARACRRLPCAVHLDGMVTNESLNALLGTLALLLLALALAAEGRRRYWLSLGFGLALAAQLLTKVSGLIPLGLVGVGAVLDWL